MRPAESAAQAALSCLTSFAGGHAATTATDRGGRRNVLEKILNIGGAWTVGETANDAQAHALSARGGAQQAQDGKGTQMNDYEPGERWDVYCAMPTNPASILDVGCGTGHGFATYMKRGVEVVGVDIDEEALREARDQLSEARLFDVTVEPWPERWRGHFDVVAFCDCLEHLRDPWAVLKRVREVLAPGGRVVSSIPNVRQIRIVAKLGLLGAWDYKNIGAGTIQRDHVRFFTRAGVRDMFDEAGYETRFYFPRQTFHLTGPEKVLNRWTGGYLADLLYGSYTTASFVRHEPRQTSWS
jgi:2-polyprenyl-3-methyl-5-hydroxy-6-metoxy-1,4-benzoquinol methylase